MRTVIYLVALLVLWAGVPAAAQGVAVNHFEAQVEPPMFGLVSVEPFEAGRPVAGAPYQAEAITEVVQMLLDGNRIEHRSTVSVARDSQGRVRREQQALAFGGLVARAPAPIVTIDDPVGGTHVMLDRDRKVAVRMSGGNVAFQAAGMATRVSPGGPNVRFTRPIDGTAVPPPMEMGVTMAFRTGADPGTPEAMNVKTESLGTKDIEGVQAEGTRVTTTIPAGAVGNQQPISVVNERWYSPELRIVVLTRRTDPRFGETTYKLTGIVRAEPAPELFDVPPDFKNESPIEPSMRLDPTEIRKRVDPAGPR